MFYCTKRFEHNQDQFINYIINQNYITWIIKIYRKEKKT